MKTIDRGAKYSEAKSLLREGLTILADEHRNHHPSLVWEGCSVCEYLKRAEDYA